MQASVCGSAVETAAGSKTIRLRVNGTRVPGSGSVCLVICLKPKPAHRPLQASLTTPDGQAFSVAYDPAFNALVARVEGLKRPRTFTHRDYDEFDLVIACDDNSTQPVPLLIDFRGPARITGLVPLLCDADGAPTGIPVQTSKKLAPRQLSAGLDAGSRDQR